MEGRLMMARDPGATLGDALPLGMVSGTRYVRDAIGGPGDVADVVRFDVSRRGNVNVYLSEVTAGAKVELLSRGGFVMKTDTVAGPGDHARVTRDLRAGRYYVRVTPTSGQATDYRLKVRADLNWGTVELDGETAEVGIVWASGTKRQIVGARNTWLLIHGLGSDVDNQGLQRLARALEASSEGEQVLMLDWSESAAGLNVLDAAAWIPQVTGFANARLRTWGMTTERLNLVGHSLGGWAAGVLAQKVKGGVNRLWAIDPATDPAPFFLSGLDYAADSRFSAAWIASSWSTPAAAGTADVAFQVDVGPFESILSHANVVDFVASMVAESNGNGGPIAELFSVAQLAPGVVQPYKTNVYEGRYEASVTAGHVGGNVWRASAMQYKDRTTNATINLAG